MFQREFILRNSRISMFLLVFIITTWSFPYLDTLFKDTFENEDKWITMNAKEKKIENGRYVITGGDASPAISTHTGKFSDFTYSVDMEILETTGAALSGIIVCLDGTKGYVFVITDKHYFGVIELNSNGSTTLEQGWFSYIKSKPGVNKLMISKKDDDLCFYCNGVLVKKIKNDKYSEGSIAFYVSNEEKVAYDNVILTNGWKDGEQNACFKESFNDGNYDGLVSFTDGGKLSCGNGALKIESGSERELVYTSGVYKNAPCTTIVTYKSGGTGEYYGIRYRDFDSTFSSSFLINGNRYYALNGIAKACTDINGKNGKPDTLIVSESYEYFINGVSLGTTPDKGYKFNVAGLVVGKNMIVEIDYFSVGSKETAMILNPKVSPIAGNKSFLIGGIGIIYDTRGRKVATFQEDRYKNELRNLGAGSYYLVIPSQDKNHMIRRAIINAK